MKRGQTEPEENNHNGKWRKHEGINRGLRDIPNVQYEEYETSWNQQDQPKNCRKSINCLFDHCVCRRGLAEGVQELQPMRNQR